ncbi:MAG: HAD family phosphatase [Methylovulum sp.]|uniref:HAD family hydrolase n=1 Tax=Methylovulum sp. TaxID=1916980 RepID=UPI0026370A81|nr:HAD family phosphatase [Methylovulum sp.]MDD2725245.1 HAD family phosphatase [Methylovulum sp.]MDD5125682.1 HAD family phosphatase [Methylovulum sp.]
MATIKNIIFDLGGVVINLDIPRTVSEFEKLGVAGFGNVFSQLAQTPLFDQFDKGLISEDVFFSSIKAQFKLAHPIAELERAWNAMLLDFPGHRLEQLTDYKQRYSTFLLSNTNETHIRVFEKNLSDTHSVANLQPFFHKIYYSCEINLRKPDPEIFEFVLQENGLKPEETVFIDDTLIHVQAAQTVGIHALHLPKGEEFKSLLDTILD